VISAGPSILKLARFVNGYPFKPEDLGVEGTPVVRIRQLLDPTADWDSTRLAVADAEINTGNLVLSWSATLAARLWHRGPPVLNQHLFRVDTTEAVDRSWFAYVLNVACTRLEPLMHGSAMTHVTRDMLRLVTVTVPPIKTQRRTADFLDAETARIDALIVRKRRMVELLCSACRRRRWRLLTQGIGGMSAPNIGVPRVAATRAAWRTIRLRHLVEQPIGGVWGAEPGEDEVDAACLRVADMDRWLGVIAAENPTVRSVTRQQLWRVALRPGDLVLEKSGGGDSQPVGFVARVESVHGPTVCSNFMAKLRPTPTVDPEYAAHVFAALYDSQLTQPHIKQTTGIQNLDVRSYLDQSWAIPHLDTQRLIVREIEAALSTCSELIRRTSAQVGLLEEHRQALITAAVTGELEALSR